MAFRIRIVFFLLTVFSLAAWAQVGSYYSTIDTSSASFVTDLHNLIYSHTKLSYFVTDVADYASKDTTNGQKYVVCVYSGEKYVYTPPFSWGTFSREHTWCHSWMPTYTSKSGPEYSDQHHLFPTNQNNANGIRSNHPLGVVVTATYTYLSAKLGTDANGYTVWEPRDSHKGDAARALLYMALCYNGANGYDWTFNHLNSVTLPALSEGPQDLNTLLQWSQQDPPDAWEQARNDSVYKYQGNRNPFVDHPSWVNLIDFNTVTKKTTTSLATEPTNYATNFAAITISDTTIKLTWTLAVAGTQSPSGYLLAAAASTSIFVPSDGFAYTDDTALGDGSAIVSLSATDSVYTFTGLNKGTTYYFKLYSFNGTSDQRNYKIDATSLPYIYGITSGTLPTASVVVNEYLNGSTQADEWVELLVLQDNLDMRGMRLRDYSGSGSVSATPIVFSNSDVWSSVKNGTFVVVLAQGSTQTEDTSFADKRVILKNSNGYYFSSSSTSSFNISGTADAVEVLSSGNTHIHLLGHGSSSWLYSLPQPKATVTGSSTSGHVVRYYNINSLSDFDSSAAKVQHSTTATMAYPNDAAESTFVYTVLPVHLTSVTSSAVGMNVYIRWTTATEDNNAGFEVQRRASDDPLGVWRTLGFVPGAGTSALPHSYSFADRPPRYGTYFYRLKQIDHTGEFAFSGERTVQIPNDQVLSTSVASYPNPFNPTTTFDIRLTIADHVSLVVFDLLGRPVAELLNERLDAGIHSVQWNAGGFPSGVYFYRFQSGTHAAAKKLLLLK